MGSTLSAPDADYFPTTGALTGGASAYAVLGDLDDATYVTLDQTEHFAVSFGDPSPAVPAGAVVKKVQLLLRMKRANPSPLNALAGMTLARSGEAEGSSVPVTSSTFVQVYPIEFTASADDEPDADEVVLILQASLPYYGLVVSTALLVVTYVAKPELTVDAPTGTLTEENVPTVSWTNDLDSDGGPQFAAEIKIFNDAQYGAGGFDPATSEPIDSGIVGGTATNWTGTVALADDTYRAYVQTGQIFGNGQSINSDWTYGGFVVDVDRPGEPAMLLTVDEDEIARVEIEIAATAGDVSTMGYELQRKVGDDEWVGVRTLTDAEGTVEL